MHRQLSVLTNSSLTCFRRCPREYKYRYVDLMKGRGRNLALEFGSLFHFGLNAWWKTPNHYKPEIRLLAGVATMREPRKDRPMPDAFELVKAETLLAGYTARWGWEGYETLGVERRFALRIDSGAKCTCAETGSDACAIHEGGSSELEGTELRGAIDAIASKAGRVYNVEHKTTSSDISPGSAYWQHVIALDSQVSTYDAASREMGFDVRGTIYDAIRKPEIVPLKATPEESRKYTKPTKAEPIPRLYANQRETDETPEEFRDRLVADIIARPGWYYVRNVIVRLDHDNEEHARDVVETARMIATARELHMYPRSPKACERYRRWCDFHPVCSGEASITDGTRYEKKTSQHEELE